MTVSFKGIGQTAAPFTVSGTLAPGDVVAMSGNGQVKKADAGDDIAGVCQSIRHGLATVIVAGHAQMTASGAVTVGIASLEADTGGKVKAAAEGGRQVLVVAAQNNILDVIL